MWVALAPAALTTHAQHAASARAELSALKAGEAEREHGALEGELARLVLLQDVERGRVNALAGERAALDAQLAGCAARAGARKAEGRLACEAVRARLDGRGATLRRALGAFYTLLELVRVDTTCWRCFEQLSSPVVLWPCGHTFCRNCVSFLSRGAAESMAIASPGSKLRRAIARSGTASEGGAKAAKRGGSGAAAVYCWSCEKVVPNTLRRHQMVSNVTYLYTSRQLNKVRSECGELVQQYLRLVRGASIEPTTVAARRRSPAPLAHAPPEVAGADGGGGGGDDSPEAATLPVPVSRQLEQGKRSSMKKRFKKNVKKKKKGWLGVASQVPATRQLLDQ